MARYGNRWVEKLIPAKGEAEVMARVKGSYGSGGRSMKRSYKKGGKWAALRRGAKRNKPDLWQLLSPRDSNDADHTRLTRNWNFHPTVGSVDSDKPDYSWLFAVTPELTPDNVNPYVLPMRGSISREEQYRVVGLQGDLWWTPLASLDETPAQEGLSGFIEMIWVKIKRQTRDADATAFGPPTQYPWSAWNTDEVKVQGSIFGWQTNLAASTSASLNNRDIRVRKDIIRHYRIPWRIPAIPVYDGVGVVFEQGSAGPIRLPLPRKIVCNVGQGECLAAAYQVYSQSNENAASAPVGVFHHAGLMARAYTMD